MLSSDLISGLCLVFLLHICSTVADNTYNPPNELPVRYPSTNDQESPYEPKVQKLEGAKKRWRKPVPAKQEPLDVKEELERLNATYVWQTSWPTPARKLGVVSQVSFDLSGNVVVFHRGDRVWNQHTFSTSNEYEGERVPIKDNTIVAFDRASGNVVYEYGKDLFYMPHGLTIDHEGNVWVTDVALHQVMKFGVNNGMTTPDIVLGVAFKPGSGRNKFCKPTAVAVLPDGQFFVADGYCNTRILKYSKSGELLTYWGQNSFQGEAHDVAMINYFAIPHALTLAPEWNVLCVADRENGRVQCFDTVNGSYHSQYHSPVIGDRLFSVAYSPIKGGQLFVVNGPTVSDKSEHYNEVRGFVIDMKSKQILGKLDHEFSNPHDIIVSPDGMEVFVAELNPSRAYKFLSVDFKPPNQSTVSVKPTVTLDNPMMPQQTTISVTKPEPGATALLVISLVVIFSLLTIGIALLISRRRKRGCLPFDNRNRRHAWDFPTVKTDSFKLGNLLDRKRGFEKLNQDASDEEQPNASTNMLA